MLIELCVPFAGVITIVHHVAIEILKRIMLIRLWNVDVVGCWNVSLRCCTGHMSCIVTYYIFIYSLSTIEMYGFIG